MFSFLYRFIDDTAIQRLTHTKAINREDTMRMAVLKHPNTGQWEISVQKLTPSIAAMKRLRRDVKRTKRRRA